MYRDRILEAKKAQGISTKTMSERSVLHLPEETISRFLTGKTADPHISTILDLAAIVGLAPHEPFMDEITAADFKLFLETRLTNIDNAAELELLKIRVAELENTLCERDKEIIGLKKDLEHKDELLEVYKHFVKIKPVE